MSRSVLKRVQARLCEEIPISFAVVLLLIHVTACVSLVFFGGRRTTNQAKQHVVQVFGDSLEHFGRTITDHTLAEPARLQAALHAFNQSGFWEGLRVVTSGGLILGSISKEEIATRHWELQRLQARWPDAPTQHWSEPAAGRQERVTFVVPLALTREQPALVLEGSLQVGHLAPGPAVFGQGSVAITGVSALLLLLACRFMHRHFRPLTTIGSHLVRNAVRLRQELSSLRLASEQTAVARAWNQMIALFEEMREVSTQARAYRELSGALERSASAAFVEAAECAPEGLLHVTDGDRLGYANAMACRLLGIDSARDRQPRASTPLAELHVSDMGRRIVQAIGSARSGGKYEAQILSVDGESETTFALKVMPVSRGSAALIRLTDVSQQSRVDRAREEFVAQVAHELRTPLTNIRAYTETFGEFDDPEVKTECFNVINKETRRLARLVEELLSRSQLDVGSIQIRHDDVDLLALLNEAVRDLKATAESKDLQLVAELPSKLPRLYADRDKLAVVINNLLGNAVKYTEPGGSVTLECRLDGEQITVEVSDTGIGISKEDQPRVFERMFRAKSDTVQQQAGTGIGLTTALEIARAHGGDIQVRSELGKGTTFAVQLPLTRRARSA